MYLPSKIRSNYIAIAALFAFLLLLPFKNPLWYLFTSLSRNLTLNTKEDSQILESLKREKLAVNLKLKEYELIARENERLKKALNFKEKNNTNFIGADIVSFNPSSWRRIVVIDAGKNQGLEKGLYAVNEDGYLIGRITETNNNYSRLMLVDDPDFGLAVFAGENCFGFLQGGLGRVKILYVENSEEVKTGDKVWFKTPFMDSPIYIGRIKTAKKDTNSLFQDIEVKLFTKNIILHKVFVIK